MIQFRCLPSIFESVPSRNSRREGVLVHAVLAEPKTGLVIEIEYEYVHQPTRERRGAEPVALQHTAHWMGSGIRVGRRPPQVPCIPS